MSYSYLQLAFILGFSSFFQGLAGFGFALISIPLLVYSGMPIATAITLAATSSLIQSTVSALKLKFQLSKAEVLKPIATRLLGISLGIIALFYLSKLDFSQIKKIVSIFQLAVVALQLTPKLKILRNPNILVGHILFFISGFTGGMLGMGGPPLVLWAVEQDWSSMKVRAFLHVMTITGVLFQLFILYSFPSVIDNQNFLEAIYTAVLFSPVIASCAILGTSLSNKISRTYFNRIAYIALILLGIRGLN